MDLIQTIFSSTGAAILGIFLLGLTIFVHELGHFLAARKRGLKIERFSIGFGPKIHSWTGRDGVEYRLAWIPFGGYVLLPQLADMPEIEGESKTPAEKLPPITFTSKVVVAAGGPVFNVIFAFILATVLWVTGQEVGEEVQRNVIGIVHANIENSEGRLIPGPAAAAGIKPGDTILAVDGGKVSTFADANEKIVLGAGRGENGAPRVTLTIRRENQTFDVSITPAYVSPEKFRSIGIAPAGKIIASAVTADSPAAEAGIKPGDQIISIDATPIQMPDAVRGIVLRSNGSPLAILCMRDGKTHAFTVTPRLVSQPGAAPIYQIGITPDLGYTPITVRILPWTQVRNLILRTWNSFAALVNPNSDIGLNKVNGPIGIVDTISRAVKQGPVDVIALMVLINIALAFFNLLPIPVLDGGHILFATIAKIKGSPLPMRFVVTTQSIFVVLLITMMVYVTFFDVRRDIRDRFQSKPAPPTPAAPAAPAEPAAEK